MEEHYLVKFDSRSKFTHNFPFADFKDVHRQVRENMVLFLHRRFPVNPIIHGDCWFSNILLRKTRFIMFDMRGKVNSHLTVQGHILYDYGKIYQSILGLDSIILYDELPNPDVRAPLEKTFWEFMETTVLDDANDALFVKRLTGYLLFNTFNFYDENFSMSKKEKIWELVKWCTF
jgi:hypothetical protein